MFQDIDQLQNALAENQYIADRGLATAIFVALQLHKPLFLEGEAGSMERYTRLLLELFHTLSHTRVKVETFVFATHLTRITPDTSAGP